MTARHSLTRVGLALTVALCGTLAVSGAHAEAKKRAAPQLVYRGCSHFVAPLCMGVTSRGRTYAVIGAMPFIPPGTGVDVYGTVTSNTPCGVPTIQVSSWRQNKLRCTR
jgi:hypothetical protein